MAEAAGGGRAGMERRLIDKSLQDEAFRRALLEDPRTAVEGELGTRLPDDIEVVAVEETADTIYLVLPSAPAAGRGGAAIPDRELDAVAGAGTWGADTCQMTCGNDCVPTAAGMFGC